MTSMSSNPICTHSLNITRASSLLCFSFHLANDLLFISDNGTTLTAPIVDFCAQCGQFNIGLSPSAFQKFASLDDGIVNNVTWVIV